jgi:hypothetical protein
MTRGPLPENAFRKAAEIGGLRGTLKWFDRKDRDGTSFAIFGTDLVALVGIRRARRIWAGPEEICREFRETIAKLKAAVLTRTVMRELWLCSYHGTWRFFQIVGWDLAELDQLGKPVAGPCIMPP